MEKEKWKSLEDKLHKMIGRFPDFFAPSIFKDRDRFLAFVENDFLSKRAVQHLWKIISCKHVSKKHFLNTFSLYPTNRYLYIRLIPAKLQFPFMSKWVVGIVVDNCSEGSI